MRNCLVNFDLFVLLVEGKVVKATRESIHLVVLGFAAAVITAEDIRDEFKFKIVCLLLVMSSESFFRNRAKKFFAADQISGMSLKLEQ